MKDFSVDFRPIRAIHSPLFRGVRSGISHRCWGPEWDWVPCFGGRPNEVVRCEE